MLKLEHPTLQAHWWIARELAPVLEADPDIDRLFLFERKKWAQRGYWLRILRTIRQMRLERYDYVIDLQGLARSGIVGWLARGKTFIGVEDLREGAFGLYDKSVPRRHAGIHAVDWYLDVVRSLNAAIRWDFQWLPEKNVVSDQIRKAYSLDNKELITICPGGRWANKRWPSDLYQKVAQRVATEYPTAQIGIIGSSDESSLASEIANAAPGRTLNFAGKTSLPELVEILRLSKALITNDTGPMHIAAALGKPVIGIFGPTDPKRTGPYGQISRVLQRELPCAPCMKPVCSWNEPLACLLGISPDQIMNELRHRIGNDLDKQ
jgi:heptosyltransferase-1